jgi:hypothetical protein
MCEVFLKTVKSNNSVNKCRVTDSVCLCLITATRKEISNKREYISIFVIKNNTDDKDNVVLLKQLESFV